MEENGIRHILKEFPQIQLLNSDYKDFALKRKFTESNMAEKFTHMPGFRLTWYYSEADIKSESRFIHDEHTMNFIRYSNPMKVLKC